jgi:hypothetical protein
VPDTTLLPEPTPPNPNPVIPIATRFFVVIVVAGVAFLGGFMPGWLKARAANSRLEAARHALQISQIQNKLASAAIDARRGEYEPARQAASQFFTDLRDALDVEGKKAVFTPAQREEARKLLQPRDEIITLLARGDPASANRLSDLYVGYRKLLEATK